jgi:hypothetical protein
MELLKILQLILVIPALLTVRTAVQLIPALPASVASFLALIRKNA